MQSNERIEFALKIVEILKEKGTEGLTAEEKQEFLDKMIEKLK
jgi:hypothetical protein